MPKINDSKLRKNEHSDHKKINIQNEYKALMKELKIVNKKLHDSEQLKSNFLSNIRNEIVNPLTTLMGLSKNLLLFDWPNKDSVREAARTIHSESLNLDFQLKNIFTAAEIEAGELKMSLSNVDIDCILNSIIDSVQHKIIEKKIVLDIKKVPKDGLTVIKTDPEKLSLVLINLILNAIEFSQEGGKVEIITSVKDNELSISIKDYGIGIDKWDQEQIFDRFKQLESGSAKKYLGHGLGLSIVKEIVEMLGGTIMIKSVKQKGSTFTIKLTGLYSNADPDFVSINGNEIFFEEAIEF